MTSISRSTVPPALPSVPAAAPAKATAGDAPSDVRKPAADAQASGFVTGGPARVALRTASEAPDLKTGGPVQTRARELHEIPSYYDVDTLHVAWGTRLGDDVQSSATATLIDKNKQQLLVTV